LPRSSARLLTELRLRPAARTEPKKRKRPGSLVGRLGRQRLLGSLDGAMWSGLSPVNQLEKAL
jgi:hypothetical protein